MHLLILTRLVGVIASEPWPLFPGTMHSCLTRFEDMQSPYRAHAEWGNDMLSFYRRAKGGTHAMSKQITPEESAPFLIAQKRDDQRCVFESCRTFCCTNLCDSLRHAPA
jgi:hypothetical protein